MPAARFAGTLTLGALAAMGARYAAARQRADTAWARRVETRLTDIGEVDELRILPLVERLGSTDVAVPGGLQCEPGLSYLVEAGGTRLLFDAGLNLKARADSPLLTNARRLGVDLGSLDAVVISHLHPDHVGGDPAAATAQLRVLRRRRSSRAGCPPTSRPGCSTAVRTSPGPPPRGSSHRGSRCCPRCPARCS